MNMIKGVCYFLAIERLFLIGTLGQSPAGNDPASVPLTGLDCRKALGVKYSYLQDVCAVSKPLSEPRLEGILILQEVKVRETSAYRCERRASVFTLYCGAYSHIKFFRAPDIEVLEEITPAECKEMSSSGHFSAEDGRSIPLIINGEITYSQIRHGTVTRTEDNVYCNGAKVTLGGEIHGGILQFETIKIRISHIRVEIRADAIVDLNNHQPVPDACLAKDCCGSEIASYYIPEKKAKCNLARVRNTMVHPVQMKTAKGVHTALVDHQHKILLPLVSKMTVSPGCQAFVKEVWSTTIPEMKVVRNLEDTLPDSLYLSTMEEIGATSVDLDLEMKISLGYLEHHFHQEMAVRMQELGRSLCNLESGRLTSAELSPFRKHSLMRTRGDLIQEIRCRPVELTARVGEQRDTFCIKGALPVYLEDEPVYISSPNHIVLEAKEVIRTPCNMTYPPVFVGTDQTTLVQADPEVKKVTLQVEHLELAKLGEFALEEEDYSDSLLYTKEEIRKMENLINFGRVQERALHHMVNSFCNSGNCGSYQPDGQLTQGFSLDQIEKGLNSPFSWLVGTWQSHLERIGAYCGLALTAMFLAYFSWLLVGRICTIVRKKQKDPSQELKVGVAVTYLPGKENTPRSLREGEHGRAQQEPVQRSKKLLPYDTEEDLSISSF